MSQKNMSQKNMSQIIVYKNQEELRSDIEEMFKEVEDIEKRIKIKQDKYEELFYNLYSDSARSVTASVRRGMPGSYDISEKAKKDLSKLYNDIEKMENKAAAIHINIDEKEKVLRNVNNAAKSGTARGKSPISNNTYISKPFAIIKNEISPKDAKYIIINDLDQRSSVASLKAINDRKQLDHMQSVNTLFAAARRASSSASRASSSASGGASSSKSSSATRALSPAARRASSSASRASSSSSKTGGLRKRRGKNLDNTKTRK